MATNGTFDRAAQPAGWFDECAQGEGWFDADLLAPPSGSPPPTFLAAWAAGANTVINAGVRTA